MHRGVTKNLRYTTYPSRRASRGDQPNQHNSPRNAYAEPQDGGNGTSQYSPYHPKHGDNGAFGTDDYDHERHTGATQDASGGDNKTNKAEE